MPGASEKTTEQDWDEQARNWIAWVRRPGLDSYWRYQEEFFELVPEPGNATLDLGCGEGRVKALEEAGLLIEAIREPVSVTRDGTVRVVPMHLWIRALRPSW